MHPTTEQFTQSLHLTDRKGDEIMKNIYTTPAVEFNTVDIKDVITTSLTSGGEGGGVFATVDIGDLLGQ